MKVICINSTPNENEFPGEMPKEGEVYTVLREVIGYDINHHPERCYLLLELPSRWYYDVRRFIPLSDIDERQLINESVKVTEA